MKSMERGLTLGLPWGTLRSFGSGDGDSVRHRISTGYNCASGEGRSAAAASAGCGLHVVQLHQRLVQRLLNRQLFVFSF